MKQYTSICGLYSLHSDTQNIPNTIVRHELHNHNQYEFYFLKKGKVLYNIECFEYPVDSGDIVLVNYHEFHKLTIIDETSYDRIVLQFDELFLSKMTQTLDLFDFFRKKQLGKNNHLTSDIVKEYGLDVYFEKLALLSNSSVENDVIVKCTLIELLIILNRIYKSVPERQAPDKVNTIYKQAIQYINDNIYKELSLDTIAQELFITKYHLCHIFKKAVGTSIHDYIITKKILLANNMIINGMPATEACFKTGFNNYSNFYRAFLRVLKVSPSTISKKG